MARTLDLGIVIFARDQASGPIRRVKLQVDSLTGSQRRQARAAKNSARSINKNFIPALRGLAFAAVGAAAALVKVALDTGEYEKEVRLAAKLIGKEGVKAFKDFDRTVRDLAIQFGQMPNDVAKVAQAVGKLGIRGDNAMLLLTGSLKTMAASMGELGAQKSVDLLAASMRSFGVDASKTDLIVDQLANVVTNTALSYDKLGLAMGTAAGLAALFGATVTETLTLLGLTKDVIPRAERGATGARNVFKDLADATKELKAAAAGMNIEIADSEGNFRNFTEVIVDVVKEIDKMNDVQKTAFLRTRFSVEAMTVLAAVQNRLKEGTLDVNGAFKDGIETFAAMEEKIRETRGTADEFVEISLFGMAGAARIAKATWEDLKIELGRAINIVLVPALKILTNVIGFFTGVLSGLGPTGATIIGVLAVLAIVAGILAVPIIALSLAVGTWSAVAKVASKATRGLGRAFRFLLGPLGIVITALTFAISLASDLAGLFGFEFAKPEVSTEERAERAAATTQKLIGVPDAGAGISAAAGASGGGSPAVVSAEGDDSEASVTDRLRDLVSSTASKFGGTEDNGVIRQPIVIQLDRRELGRAVVEFQREESRRKFTGKPELT